VGFSFSGVARVDFMVGYQHAASWNAAGSHPQLTSGDLKQLVERIELVLGKHKS
jgi:hypothetical protein